jgi:hypothetical protein
VSQVCQLLNQLSGAVRGVPSSMTVEVTVAIVVVIHHPAKQVSSYSSYL